MQYLANINWLFLLSWKIGLALFILTIIVYHWGSQMRIYISSIENEPPIKEFIKGNRLADKLKFVVWPLLLAWVVAIFFNGL